MMEVIHGHLAEAQAGGVPGADRMIRAYLNIKLKGGYQGYEVVSRKNHYLHTL